MTSLSCLLIVCISVMNYAPSAAFCLQYMSCYNEAFVIYDKLEIHHEDHEVRSATVCAGLCLREDPETPMVFVKVIEMNERLVCGCGDETALGNRSGTLNDFFYCKKCPDSEEKCGGMSSISVYLILHKEDECDEPRTTVEQKTTPSTTTTATEATTKETTLPSTQEDLLLVGCYRDINVTQVELTYLSDPEATVNACATTCSRNYPEKELYMAKYNGTGLLCGCG